MVFKIRSLNEPIRLQPPSKRLRADEVAAWEEGQSAVAAALAYADRMRSDAQEAYEAQRALGYAEGLRQAGEEKAAELLRVENQTALYFSRITDSVVQLVLDAVRKLVQGFDDGQQVLAVVHSCLDLMRTERHLRLHVHPDQVGFLRSQVAALLVAYPGMAQIEVHPDEGLARDGCRVESEIGVAEASLHGQLEALLQALASVFIAPPAAGSFPLDEAP
ncbi:type III secretion system stator protein SctL [uncultured Hydrogenophaga sp.]|uniref:type III secretion system stator protein SctL n=1 Tax=uncultured Hydrogenophaga sp. TaxID=199683 RepID=UPI00265EAE0E|nr:type III secretion system stator protein SctL [uncultured Hydrogenophaga sp.]